MRGISPHFIRLQALPHNPKLHLHHTTGWTEEDLFFYKALIQLQSPACDRSQWLFSSTTSGASAFSIRTHMKCGSTLGTFWSHQFSPQVMNPSNHVPIEMRNQKWLWQHSSPSNTTIKGRDFLKSKFTRQEPINKVCEFSSGKGICSSCCLLTML